MDRVRLVVTGKPFGWKRATPMKFGRAVTPADLAAFENAVGHIARPLFPQPLCGPVRVVIVAVFEVPASWSQKRRRAAMGAYYAKPSDADNLAKAICDGLNRIAYADDGQVAELLVRKVWGIAGETRVTVEPLPEAAT